MLRRTLLASLASLPLTKAKSQSIMDIMKESPLGDIPLGEAYAPITIVEYASLTCHFCVNFHNDVMPLIKEHYIKTGKVKFIYREFPLNNLAMAAAMLARCAPKEQFHPITDVLFKTKEQWGHAPNPAEALFQISQQAGFTKERFEGCLSNQPLLDKLNATRKQGEDLKVDATPTFFINGKRYTGIKDFAAMQAILDPLLK